MMKSKLQSRVNVEGRRAVSIRIAATMFAVMIGAFSLYAIACAIVRAYGGGNSPVTIEAEKPASIAATATPAPAKASLRSAAPQGEVIQGKLVTLTPGGFEPEELLVTQNKFLLAIENRSRLDTISVRLAQPAGSSLRSAQLASSRPVWSEVFALPPGEYLLTEDSHPDWVCKITVKPR